MCCFLLNLAIKAKGLHNEHWRRVNPINSIQNSSRPTSFAETMNVVVSYLGYQTPAGQGTVYSSSFYLSCRCMLGKENYADAVKDFDERS